jgi:pimeloyl-ACP methyl ester carboxylesterase
MLRSVTAPERPSRPTDSAEEPEPMVVRLASGERIAYLAWPGPNDARPVLLVHGLSRTSWSWLPVARRLARRHPIVAPDLRGHGASDAPREGYELESLALDMLTVVAAQGWGSAVGGPAVVVAGHGLGAIVAVEAARLEPASVAALVLVDGGWEEVGETTRLSPPELIAAMADPPEVLASMETYLADRREFEPASWDADQERAARAAVVERHAGHVSPVVRASVMRRLVDTLYAYQPLDALGRLTQPVIVLVAGTGTADDEERRERLLAVEDVQDARRAARFQPMSVRLLDGAGHELMRYRPDAVAAAIAEVAASAP